MYIVAAHNFRQAHIFVACSEYVLIVNCSILVSYTLIQYTSQVALGLYCTFVHVYYGAEYQNVGNWRHVPCVSCQVTTWLFQRSGCENTMVITWLNTTIIRA